MILGIGTDIVSISRVEALLKKFGARFLNRVFTQEERDRALPRFRPGASLAARFAAKEACAKALGIAIRQGVTFLDFSIGNDAVGKPQVKIFGKAAERLNSLTPGGMESKIDISLSDEGDNSIAMVVISACKQG